MKKVLLGLGVLLLLNACDSNRIFEKNDNIPEFKWHFSHQPEFEIEVTDTLQYYTLRANFRVTDAYPNSNLFVLIHEQGPGDSTFHQERKEFTFLSQDGSWLGKSSGEIIEFSIPFRARFRFPKTGIYKYRIEQNMRNDALEGIINVGLRLEKYE